MLLAGAHAFCGLGCGDSAADPAGSSGTGGAAGGGAGSSGAAAGSSAAGGSAGEEACNAVVEEHPPTGATHREACSDIVYSSNPASGGDHYGVWAAFQSYGFAVPEGFVVHALEHGAVAFWYDCADGCADEVAEVEAFIDALPDDPACAGTGVSRRVLLVPRPGLSTRWAASSWGYTLSADCFDADAFRAFYDAHYGLGPEDLCAAGQAFTENPCQ